MGDGGGWYLSLRVDPSPNPRDPNLRPNPHPRNPHLRPAPNPGGAAVGAAGHRGPPWEASTSCACLSPSPLPPKRAEQAGGRWPRCDVLAAILVVRLHRAERARCEIPSVALPLPCAWMGSEHSGGRQLTCTHTAAACPAPPLLLSWQCWGKAYDPYRWVRYTLRSPRRTRAASSTMRSRVMPP